MRFSNSRPDEKRHSTMQRFRKILILIVLTAFLLRLYKLTTPLADWHSFRQADTASVTREYVKHGIDWLHPRYHDLSNIQSGMQNGGQDNLQGYRMVEFPLINGLLAMFLRNFPMFDLVIVSRLASILASLVSLVCLVILVRSSLGKRVALLAGALFATLPYSVYYSRVILPEPFFIAFTLASLVLFLSSIQKKSFGYGALSAALLACALLVKPMAIFFAPVYLAIWWQERKRITLADVRLGVIFILSAIPLLLWRRWIQQFPLGIPASTWLYNGGGPEYALSPLYHIRFRPAWFRWLFYERLTKLFLGYIGVGYFAAGLLFARKNLLVLAFASGALSYVSIFAAGNVQHDYYQVLLVPFICIATAIGIEKCLRLRFGGLIVGISLLVMYSLAWRQVQGYYNINNWDTVVAGQAVDRLVPAEATVIAPYQGDTAFLFQTNRTGWPIGFDIDKKISEGASIYVSVNYDDEARALEKKYKTIEKTPKYIILNLTEKI